MDHWEGDFCSFQAVRETVIPLFCLLFTNKEEEPEASRLYRILSKTSGSEKPARASVLLYSHTVVFYLKNNLHTEYNLSTLQMLHMY